MTAGIQVSDTAPVDATETAQFTWTETRTYNAVVIPLSAVAALLTEHAPGDLTAALAELLENNADEESYRPVFTAMAAYTEPGDIEVTEICDVSAEY